MKLKKGFIILFIISFLSGLVIIYVLYGMIFKPSVRVPTQTVRIFIPTGASLNQVLDSLRVHTQLKDEIGFRLLAKFFGYPKRIFPGSYLIKDNWTNLQLILILRSGKQTPVRLTINPIRTLNLLLQRLTNYTEVDYRQLRALLTDSDYTRHLGFDTSTVICMFIPNTYEVYWTITTEELIKKFQEEYKKFWNSDRIFRARKIFLTPVETMILASIVEAETQHNDEKSRIAGVYMNRLRIGMPLQADPTVVFGTGDFTLKRVTNEHKNIDSKYNTYRYTGLPPGPINLPSISSIEAVLNTEMHMYLYFCAKEDLSGTHNFACTFNEHLQNARKYQKALDEKNIH